MYLLWEFFEILLIKKLALIEPIIKVENPSLSLTLVSEVTAVLGRVVPM
jgi:hypothetical protein